MNMRLPPGRTSDDGDPGHVRDLEGERGRDGAARDPAEAGARGFERDVAADPGRRDEAEPCGVATFQQRKADHLVHGVVAADFLDPVKEGAAVREGGGVDAAGLAVLLAGGVELAEQGGEVRVLRRRPGYRIVGDRLGRTTDEVGEAAAVVAPVVALRLHPRRDVRRDPDPGAEDAGVVYELDVGQLLAGGEGAL